MGFPNLKAEAAKLIMKEVAAKIHELNPAELIEQATKVMQAEIALYDGDLDKNGVIDKADIAADFAVINEKSAHIMKLVKLAHEGKK